MNVPSRAAEATITGDPLPQLEVGSAIDVVPFVHLGTEGSPAPEPIANWEAFDGSLIAIGLRSKLSTILLGSGVIVGPGLAVTATHILKDDLDQLNAGSLSAFAVGVRGESADIWQITGINFDPVDDTAYLSMTLISPIPEGWAFRAIPMTTRCPQVGEMLAVIGFRFPQELLRSAQEPHESAVGALYISRGQVSDVFPARRDDRLLNYPSFQIECGALPSMSGGAILDASGHLIGIVSRGLSTTVGETVTYGSWLAPTMGRQLNLPWPPGVYPAEFDLAMADIPGVWVEGREMFQRDSEGNLQIRIWP